MYTQCAKTIKSSSKPLAFPDLKKIYPWIQYCHTPAVYTQIKAIFLTSFYSFAQNISDEPAVRSPAVQQKQV